MPAATKADLTVHFNTSISSGNIMCTKDDTLALNVELANSILKVSVRELRNKRILKTLSCSPKAGTQFNDNTMHKINIVKKGVNQVLEIWIENFIY